MDLDHVPQWAYSWCYIFAVYGVLALLNPLISLLASKQLGLPLALLLAATGLMSAATNFTLFWMCRSSLRGQRNMTV
jgi:hypothetical protein